MEVKTIKVCDAVHIIVDCEENDPVDVKAGGPPMLGYDFYISTDDFAKNVAKMENDIKTWLTQYGKPLVGISHNVESDFNVEHLWSAKQIEECIKNDSY